MGAVSVFTHANSHQIYTLSLHDALPISEGVDKETGKEEETSVSPVQTGTFCRRCRPASPPTSWGPAARDPWSRAEQHTAEVHQQTKDLAQERREREETHALGMGVQAIQE